jgi:predicted tellurium resistance membrane protein TerC
MDLSLSVDNVVVAVAMSPKLWVVCTGVFIGILALRLVAGYCIQLIERYPILEHTAFVLIGLCRRSIDCEASHWL